MVRPDQTKAALPQHENCEFPKFDSDSEGNGIWRVVSGVKGSTHEVTFDVNVQTNGTQFYKIIGKNGTCEMVKRFHHQLQLKSFKPLLNTTLPRRP